MRSGGQSIGDSGESGIETGVGGETGVPVRDHGGTDAVPGRTGSFRLRADRSVEPAGA